MRIVVTGREGQVARSLVERAREIRGLEVIAIGRPALDLLRPETVHASLEVTRPDLVVSAAAYTAVDQAEDEPEQAHGINATGAGATAAAAAALGVPVIHLSTDYVFDGTKKTPYTEEDTPSPKSVYGTSKLAGEKAVAEVNRQHFIVRTAWVYSPFGKNFVKTMLRLAERHGTVSVVADQWGNPTSAHDIADAILIMSNGALRGRLAAGVYHLAGAGAASWADFARSIMATSRKHGGPHAKVRNIATIDYPTKALRPVNSQLATDKLAQACGWMAPAWEQSVEAVVERLLDKSIAQ